MLNYGCMAMTVDGNIQGDKCPHSDLRASAPCL